MTESERDSLSPVVANYEDRLASDFEFALREGGRFFERRSEAHATLRRLAEVLGASHVPYAVAGGMACFVYGYRRFTEVVEVLVTSAGVHEAHASLIGRGFARPFPQSRNLRDVASGVRVVFLLDEGAIDEDPGNPDGRLSLALVEIDGISYLSLEGLVELNLKAAERDRLAYGALVVEMIKACDLPESLADRLNDVELRSRYLELHRALYAQERRYLRYWSPKSAADAGFSLDEALAAGLSFEPQGETGEEGFLVTTDRTLAKRFGLEDESEFLLD